VLQFLSGPATLSLLVNDVPSGSVGSFTPDPATANEIQAFNFPNSFAPSAPMREIEAGLGVYPG
jgi:hypothetical protein